MRRRLWTTVAAAILSVTPSVQAENLGVFPGSRVASQVPDSKFLQGEINELRTRLAALEKSPHENPTTAELSSYDAATATDDCIASPGVCNFPCQPSGNWVGGVNLYVLKAHWNTGNTAFTTTTAPVAGPGGPGTTTYTATPFSYDYSATPGAWFGYVHASGYGLRSNFFQYSQSSGVTTTAGAPVGFVQTINGPNGFVSAVFPGTSPFFRANSSLAVNYFDAEATKTVNACNWSWTGSAGLRYLYQNQTFQAGAFNAAGVQATGLSTRQFFNGGGPTLSLDGRRPVGFRGLGFYGSGRGALMFGTTSRTATAVNALTGSTQVFSANNWGTVPFGELEFGGDYRRRLGRATLVVENGLIGQAYFGVGSSSGFSSAPAFANGILVPGQSSAILGLYGLRSSIGITY